MKTKKDRLNAIRNMVSLHTLSNQEELLNLLIKEGFGVTQATLSRDIKELRIIKSPGTNGSYIYTLPTENNYINIQQENANESLLARGFISLEFSNNLAVLKTRPGYAMGIASEIDNRASREILGTLAGDDTILIIPKEGFSREEITAALAYFIPNILINPTDTRL